MNIKIVFFIIFYLFLRVCAQIYHMPNKTELNYLWTEYKQNYNKTYYGIHESRRRANWEDNVKRIVQHNKEAKEGGHSYIINTNHLSDLNTRTYLQKMAKLTQSIRRKLENPEVVGDFYERYHHLPNKFDWRKEGFVTPVYNQRDCGSCYAFSIALVLEGQLFKDTGKLVPLSSQQLVDCSTQTGNYGCSGGSLRNTLRYLDKAGGIMTYKDYPYTGKQTRCRFLKDKVVLNTSSWAILPPKNERAMEIAVAKIGPIAASINASPHTFQLYHSGVYDDSFCSSHTVNHAMLIVGYTEDAWILKNWWGGHWGENGYMRLRRGVNRCGVANFVAYVLI